MSEEASNMDTPTPTAGGSRSQTNGLLPVQAAQTPANGARQVVAKPSSLKLKLIVRRLAPGLTEEEFLSVLGEEWKVGKGKVDWFRYKAGKDSKDPSKPSRPSRAYLHLTSEAHLLPFSDVIRQSTFEDAQNTFTNSCLIGPPAVEFAPYNRTPGGRRRVDARAGTIDQDPEFMSFLEGLANPVATKDINADAVGEGSSGKQEKVTTTPLVQFLKEKKASKTKEAAVKAAKKQEAKGKASSSSPEDTKKKGKEAKVEKSVERAAKEAVKILNREAAKAAAEKPSAGSATASSEAGSDVPKLDFLAHVPPRHRSAATATHIRMLQRDLGFSPAQAHRQVRRDTADAQKAERVAAKEKAAAEPKEPTSPTVGQAPAVPITPKSTQSNRKLRNKGTSTESESSKTSNPAGPNKSAAVSISNATASGPLIPVILLRKPEATASTPKAPPPQAPKAQPAVLARKAQPVPVPSDGATQAFVKHANASQGVTEPLLKEAMEKFGAVSHVEIDRRKGFAYVDFVDTEGLKKAMAANPISVGQGTVQVLQRKGTALAPEKKPPNNPQNNAPRGGRGARGGGTVGRRGGRGGGRGGGGAAAEASKAPSAPSGSAAK